MSDLVALVATLLFIVAGGVVGFRLILLSRRTGGQAERWLGLALFSIAALGYPLVLASGTLTVGSSRAMASLGTALLTFGWCCLWVFTWRTFRAEASWARSLALLAIAASTATTLWRIGRLLSADPESLQAPSVDALATQVLALCLYLWTAAESFHYHGLLRRRCRLGLADPAVANRFLLWGLTGLFSFLSLVVPVAAAFAGNEAMVAPTRLVTGVSGTACAVILYLAFMPPRAYLDWVRQGSAATV